MNTMEAILTRRSIRQYTSQPVSGDLIKDILKAAMYAPSAANQQPWHFIVITERHLLDEIPKFHQYAQMLKDAPVAILVCCDLEMERVKGYWEQDCSAATQNILLSAHSLGLGSVWLGIYPNDNRVMAIKKLFNFPENIIPFSLVALGYPAEEKTHPDRYNTSRIHYNHW